ncbi:MAG: transposase [Vulcanimicrobiaceae bacterium]
MSTKSRPPHFASRKYRQQLTEYGLTQEFIHPHTPEQNGVIEAYHKTFKRECVWQHRFKKLDEVVRVVSAWIERYNTRRPHSSLGYLTPQARRERDLPRITSLSV